MTDDEYAKQFGRLCRLISDHVPYVSWGAGKPGHLILAKEALPRLDRIIRLGLVQERLLAEAGLIEP